MSREISFYLRKEGKRVSNLVSLLLGSFSGWFLDGPFGDFWCERRRGRCLSRFLSQIDSATGRSDGRSDRGRAGKPRANGGLRGCAFRRGLDDDRAGFGMRRSLLRFLASRRGRGRPSASPVDVQLVEGGPRCRGRRCSVRRRRRRRGDGDSAAGRCAESATTGWRFLRVRRAGGLLLHGVLLDRLLVATRSRSLEPTTVRSIAAETCSSFLGRLCGGFGCTSAAVGLEPSGN